LAFLGTLAAGSLAAALLLRPIPQNPAYHQFADARTFLELPNFLNVASNLPFLVAGLYGLYNALRKQDTGFLAAWVRWPWVALMASIFLTGFGSSYYHWAPADATLFWDRLPMATAFAAVLGITLIERVDLDWGKRLWAPLLIAGAGSLLYWRWIGDLRFYGLLQGWAIVLVPLMLILYPARYSRTRDWFLGLSFYALAKILEHADASVYRLGGLVSGHTLKHLSAGLASGFIVWHLHARSPNSSDGTPSSAA
jgi:hypothetical protein